jgi:hypothetical protein
MPFGSWPLLVKARQWHSFSDNDSANDAACVQAGRTVVATQRGSYPPHRRRGRVRRVLHELRSRVLENLNEQFKGIFNAHG